MRTETSPEDVGGMHAAAGILTARGGMTSHAAVVARGWGKCCVSGCSDIQVNEANKVILSLPFHSDFRLIPYFKIRAYEVYCLFSRLLWLEKM